MRAPRPRRRPALLLVATAALCLLALAPASAGAQSSWWQLLSGSRPSNLPPGGSGRLVLTATNLGNAPVDGTSTPVVIVDQLPAGVEAVSVEAFAGAQGSVVAAQRLG